jgi:hypothetical protein
MNLHIKYNEPKKRDICVAFCYFNTCGYIRSLQNLAFFETKLRLAKIPYFSAEMVIGDQPPMLASPTLCFRSKSSLFYKEALWNRLEQAIPQQYTKICFLDSDIIFDRPDWLDEISRLLDTHDVVHPFKICHRLNHNFIPELSSSSYLSDIDNMAWKDHGFGWCLTREFFKKIGGFFYKCVMPNGDHYFRIALVQENVQTHPSIHDEIIEYKTKFIGAKYTYLESTISHLYHGTFIKRSYDQFNKILDMIKPDWSAVFLLNADGFWELKDPVINSKYIEYFKSREEDIIKPPMLSSRKFK